MRTGHDRSNRRRTRRDAGGTAGHPCRGTPAAPAEGLPGGLVLAVRAQRLLIRRRLCRPAGIPALEPDPDLHDALMVKESGKHEENIVIEEFEKGYRMKDKVIRHAKVVVSK